MAGPFPGQVDSANSSGVNTPALDAGDFEGSKNSTPADTPSYTPSVASDEAPRPTAYRTVTDAVPALTRDFPKPNEDLDVAAALARQPGRWTIKGQMEANERRAKLAALNTEAAKEKRAQDFEATKKDLLSSFQGAPARRS